MKKPLSDCPKDLEKSLRSLHEHYRTFSKIDEPHDIEDHLCVWRSSLSKMKERSPFFLSKEGEFSSVVPISFVACMHRHLWDVYLTSGKEAEDNGACYMEMLRHWVFRQQRAPSYMMLSKKNGLPVFDNASSFVVHRFIHLRNTGLLDIIKKAGLKESVLSSSATQEWLAHTADHISPRGDLVLGLINNGFHLLPEEMEGWRGDMSLLSNRCPSLASIMQSYLSKISLAENISLPDSRDNQRKI